MLHIILCRTSRFQTGRPDGGEGGNGGCVIFVADSSLKSLNALTTNYRGRNGEHGRSSYHAGKGGANIVVKVTVHQLNVVYSMYKLRACIV